MSKTRSRIAEHFEQTGNRPALYYGLMHLAGQAALDKAITEMLAAGELQAERRAVGAYLKLAPSGAKGESDELAQ